MRPFVLLVVLCWAARASTHDYPPGGDCVRANLARPLTAEEVLSKSSRGVVCKQREAPAAAIRVGCVGDSITAVGHTSGVAHRNMSAHRLTTLLCVCWATAVFNHPIADRRTCPFSVSCTSTFARAASRALFSRLPWPSSLA